MGSINLRRRARRPRIRRTLLLVVVLLAAVTAVHHMQPEGGEMPGMHGIAAVVCLGMLVSGAVIAGRRGIARLARGAASIRWAPRLTRLAAATVPTSWLVPARDGPRRHLRLQVIRR